MDARGHRAYQQSDLGFARDYCRQFAQCSSQRGVGCGRGVPVNPPGHGRQDAAKVRAGAAKSLASPFFLPAPIRQVSATACHPPRRLCGSRTLARTTSVGGSSPAAPRQAITWMLKRYELSLPVFRQPLWLSYSHTEVADCPREQTVDAWVDGGGALLFADFQ